MAQSPVIATDTLQLPFGDTTRLTHAFLVPFSERIALPEGERLEAGQYQINYESGWVILTDSTLDNFPFFITYRYFRRFPPREIAIRKFKITPDTTAVDIIYNEDFQKGPDVFWETSNIRKSGSLTRGITVGNNRGLSVNSGLRLQLEGDLGDGLKIAGSITDENIPIQPDGTTQQISDFDKVFIKLSKDKFSATIGDYEVAQKQTRFANYYRNVQGLQLAFDGKRTKASVSGAVAKGKFHTNSFNGMDGVSGPYRLTGRNGERFFIVLAGSERVRLNGKLMQRGENLDYIIDYNTAEVTFTPRHVITNITRIVIDFEYNDRYYNRSLVVANLDQKLMDDKLRLRLSYSRDADNPNAPFDNPEAFDAARSTLRNIGDSQNQATTTGVFEVGFDEDELRYARRDTIINGETYERYVYSVDPDSAIYGIFFSFVGAGNGFYTRDRSGVNNNVFTWTPPDLAGNPTGDYAPVRTWVLPRLLQVVDAQVDYQINDKVKLYSETAISSDDQNRLSPLGDGDNLDLANRAGLSWEKIKLSDSLTLSVDVNHQYVGARYTNLDRIYRAEYNRVWNLRDDEGRRDEHIGTTRMNLNYKNQLLFSAEGGVRNTGIGRTAYRQVYTLNSNLPKFLQGNYTLTHITNRNDSLGRLSEWLRHEGDVYMPVGIFRPGVEIWIEDKAEKKGGHASDGSIQFIDLKPYIRTFNTQKFQLDASFNYRFDREYAEGKFRDKTLAYTWFLKSLYRPSPIFNIQTITSYRQLDVVDSTFTQTGLQNSRVFSTNLQSTFAPKNRLIYTNIVYDVSAEQLAQQEIRFIEVNPGQGQYVWLDSLFNNDGIQDVEEFQLANNPLIANFIRVVVPTRELFPTTRLSFSGNVRWDLRKVIPKSNRPFRELLRNIRANTNFRIIQSKSRNTQFQSYLINVFDPFGDTTLLNANFNLRQDLSFFQNSPTGDIRFAYLDNRSQLFLSTGDEFRSFRYFNAAQRLNLSTDKSLEAETRFGRKRTLADAFATRNYDIFFIETNPQINFQFSRKFRLTTGYKYTFKRNTTVSSEIDARVNIHRAVFESRLNLKARNNILTKLELIGLQQQGQSGFSAEYELREGLQPGFNAIWQAFVTVYLLSNVELSLTYDGRASAETKVVHTGRIQVRAFF